jgi:hypothetical protein
VDPSRRQKAMARWCSSSSSSVRQRRRGTGGVPRPPGATPSADQKRWDTVQGGSDALPPPLRLCKHPALCALRPRYVRLDQTAPRGSIDRARWFV